jgi:hypothetical protein
MRWITIWIMANSTLLLLLLTYFYLNHELESYGLNVFGIFSILMGIPYLLWKYNQIKFVEKRSIVIQILQD